MNIQQNISLKNYNTFGIDVLAKHFVSAQSVDELQEVLKLTDYSDKFILGGGSNMLLTKDIDALVVHIDIKGKDIVKQDANHIEVQCMAGENWHEFVLWCIDHDLGGLENMSLIPGNVGTAPIQNIGAYGVELKDTFVSCDAIEVSTGKIKTFTKEDCGFDYRNSVFKNELKGKHIIISVNFKLTTSNHKIKTSYGAIKTELAENGIVNPSIKEVSDAVIAIRQSKLPDPKELGNSGSFFKNPIVSKEEFDAFYKSNPNAPHYIVSDTEVKIPAGWLIEQAGFKGKRFGDAGVHKNQALVLVNYDNASGTEIWELAVQIQKTVKEQFGILIEPEVNVI
ncbi:UDP-N-acetylmuramate dehydrogenase [Spongiivirga citrea]|uniref:UDP-N-acetylenolpyruvoylglucosamine reductase n=1 Tax=Spongiivirga citrea TaxID=1481457 RepID=A0A6M0CR98_9FLAO|nr:UDP-N-acetylmuramate dehydrogenase [Spongiivirga citrea]NER18389.1 UDP-N-acetylmuramate dehydrogenase [Spongiivirga citrea]